MLGQWALYIHGRLNLLKSLIPRAGCNMPFYVKDLCISGFWYPQRILYPIPCGYRWTTVCLEAYEQLETEHMSLLSHAHILKCSYSHEHVLHMSIWRIGYVRMTRLPEANHLGPETLVRIRFCSGIWGYWGKWHNLFKHNFNFKEIFLLFPLNFFSFD